MLNSTGSPPDNERLKQNTAATKSTPVTVAPRKSQHSRLDSESSLLHPQTESVQGDHQQTPQQQQLMIQTWHGEESMLHQSLRGIKPVHRSQSQRGRQLPSNVAETNKDSSHESKGNRDNQSAILPMDSSSGFKVPLLTIEDLESVPPTNMQNRPRAQIPTNVRNSDRNNNQNNNANQPQERQQHSAANQSTAASELTNQNAPTTSNPANQNGVWDQDEYDTIPTRDSDEFVPISNSSSSHNGGNQHGNGHQNQPETSRNPGDDQRPRNVPAPPDYHSTYAFAQPQMPPLLSLNNDGVPSGPPQNILGPPPPPSTVHGGQEDGRGFGRHGWGPPPPAENIIHPYTTQHMDNHTPRGWLSSRPTEQHYPTAQQSQTQPPDYNINNFLPPIPLLTLNSRGPLYHPSQTPLPSARGRDGPFFLSPRVHEQEQEQRDYHPPPPMPLLTLDPTPSYQRPEPHFKFATHIPYHPPKQRAPPVARDPAAPPPAMSLLHLDGPPQPYLFKSSRGGVGTVQLIPSDDIIAYEQQKHKEKAERLRRQRELLIGQENEELVEDARSGAHAAQLLCLDSDEEDASDTTRYVIYWTIAF